MTVIGRVDDGDARWYIDPLSGAQYASVTFILGAAHSKPWLTPWSAKIAAETAVEHHDLIGQLLNSGEAGARESAVTWLKDAARRRREIKAEIGTYCHDVVEALILDTPIPTPPEHLLAADGSPIVIDGESVDLDRIIDGFTAFVEDFDPDFLMAEATVANPTHGYAGTLDFVARLRRLNNQVVGIDTKTGAVLDEWMNPQLAAYRRADEVWLNDLGDRARMPAWDLAAILHLRTDYARGYKLLDQPADDQAFAWFLACRKQLEFVEAAPPVRGRPLYPARPDGSQPPMLLEDVESEGLGRCKAALRQAGIGDVAELAAFTVGDLLALPGVGEASVLAIVEALAAHQLTLTGPAPCPGGTADVTRRDGRRLVADCPSCGRQVPSAKTGLVRFHVQPEAVAA